MAVGGQRLTFTVHNSELNTINDEKLEWSSVMDKRYVIKASKWRALKPTFLSTNSPFVNADNEIYTGPNNYLTTLVFRVWCGMTQEISYTDETKQTVSSRSSWVFMDNESYKKILTKFSGTWRRNTFVNIPSGIDNEIFRNNIGDLPTGSIPEGMTPDNFIGGYFDNGIPITNWSVLDENLIYIANKCNVVNCSTFFNYDKDSPGKYEDDYGNNPFMFTNYYGTNSVSAVDTEEPAYVNSFSNILYTPVINQIAQVDRPTIVQSYRGLYQRILLIANNNNESSSEEYVPVIEFCPIVAKYDSSQIGGDTSGQ